MNKTINNDSMLHNASGPMPVTLRNDLMFHFIMQETPNALKGLVCALKGIDPTTVKSVVLMNTIDYGRIRSIADEKFPRKSVVLDVKVLLNDDSILEIELQLYYDSDWIKRSLLYLCRSFDSIGSGEDYRLLKPTTLVAITDNSSGIISPGFYSRYLLRDERTHEVYSSIFGLNVLNLSHIDEATETDKASGLLYWANMFRVYTWEEMKNLVSGKPDLEEAAMTMYSATADQHTLSLMEGHERYLHDLATLTRAEREATQALSSAKAKLSRTAQELNNKEQELSKTEQELSKKEKELNKKDQTINDLLALLKEHGIDPEKHS